MIVPSSSPPALSPAALSPAALSPAALTPLMLSPPVRPGATWYGPGRAAGLLAGGVLDAVLADPSRAHPVAAFGAATARAEAWLWSDSRAGAPPCSPRA